MSSSNSKSLPKSNMRVKRLAAEVSQLELSLRTGVSRWRIGLAERGALELRTDEVKRIEGVLKQNALSHKRLSKATKNRLRKALASSGKKKDPALVSSGSYLNTGS